MSNFTLYGNYFFKNYGIEGGAIKIAVIIGNLIKNYFIENEAFFGGALFVEGTGFYIFKLLGHKPKELSDINEVKDQIYNSIFQQKFRDRFNIWLEKLKRDAFIDIKKHVG